MKINSISITDPCFENRLSLVTPAPKKLFYIGNPSVTGPTVAVIGTRKPTPYGKSVTLELAEKLAKRGVVIVSGLALGIDSIAHQGALNVCGRTIAVLANGLDSITPSSHRQLAIRILESDGGLISEYEPGTPPLQYRFLERNRLVSGLSDAVIVTEASAKSGTMNTVMHALSQGRDVYAIPGNISSPSSAGCNKLIEQGAAPIVNINEFVESFCPSTSDITQTTLLAQSPEEQTIIDLIKNGVNNGEELMKRSKLDAVTFSTTLTMLELRSVIHPLGSNHWSL